MSSNNHHISLTRDNYEEAFLLYVDNELTAEAKKAVEAFALLHPDLNEELHLLCSTRVPADALLFHHKENLLADRMKVAAVDESLLLYIDAELPRGEKEAVESRLKQDPAFALQHQQLLKAKLPPEKIGYPNKAELYRRTGGRILPHWLRVAAAVVVIAAGTAVWMNSDPVKNPDAGVAIGTPKKAPQQAAPTPKEDKARLLADETKTVAAAGKNEPVTKAAPVASNTVAVKQPAKAVKKRPFSKPHSAVEANLAHASVPAARKAPAAELKNAVASKTALPGVNNPVVTSPATPAYVPIDAAAKKEVPAYAAATTTNNEKKGGSVKGFLRKATRFIERRTGIKAVNDDNELLVGAVALQL